MRFKPLQPPPQFSPARTMALRPSRVRAACEPLRPRTRRPAKPLLPARCAAHQPPVPARALTKPKPNDTAAPLFDQAPDCPPAPISSSAVISTSPPNPRCAAMALFKKPQRPPSGVLVIPPFSPHPLAPAGDRAPNPCNDWNGSRHTHHRIQLKPLKTAVPGLRSTTTW